jgi:hypothetical protein
MRIRRWLKRLLAIGLLLLTGGILIHFILRPVETLRMEIFKGVHLTVESIPTESGNGRVMIAEVHWDAPGITIHNRPYDFPIKEDSPHYRLSFADWGLLRSGAALLVNTAIYKPDDIGSILPGSKVRSLDTLVVDGEVSHVHPHSYLLYWDKAGNATVQSSKPPSEDSLSAAVTGIGLQGLQVKGGQPDYRAIAGHDERFARTFIGIDPERKILFLMAFEEATATYMIDRAVAAGVVAGGQVDSGSSTNLLVGAGADGVRSHCGIRNWRPLGPWLVVEAEPL